MRNSWGTSANASAWALPQRAGFQSWVLPLGGTRRAIPACGSTLGALAKLTAKTYSGATLVNTVTTTNNYAWFDGAVTAGTTVYTDYADATPDTDYATTNTLAASGAVAWATIDDGRPRRVTFVNDANGQIVARDEQGRIGSVASGYSYVNSSGGDPHARWYRFDGREMGSIGNNGKTDASYDASVDTRRAPPGTGAFAGGASIGVGYARFGQGWEAVSSFGQGADGGRYTVQAGDTLAGIAMRLWGDANLWYKLAQANGLTGDGALIEGQWLAIPAGVVRSGNSTSSMRPYDPDAALGDLSPTTPAPQAATAAKKKKCGVFGAILLVAVAVAVTVVTSGAIVAVAAHQSLGAGIGAVLGTSAGAGVSVGFGTGLAAGTIGAAVGSAASQGIGIATGLQDKFSWKGVGIASLTAFLGPVPIGKVAGSAFVGNVIGGALTSAAVQGVAIASGLQSKFDWAGAAAAGVGGAVVASAGGAFRAPGSTVAAAGQQFAAGAAGAIANAAARSLLTGTSFGDNVLAALPETIGSTIGRAVGERIAGGGSTRSSGSQERGSGGQSGGIGFDYQLDASDPRFALTGVDTTIDPYRGVMTVAEVRAHNDSVDAGSATSTGTTGRDVYPSTAKIILDRGELERSAAAFHEKQSLHGLYLNSAEIEAGITNNRQILDKADWDFAQSGKYFLWEYGKTGLYVAAGEGTAFVLGKAIGTAAPLIVSRFSRAAETGPITQSIGDLRSLGLKDAHHVIQDAAVRDLPGYNTRLSPGVQLEGPSTLEGSAHYNATQAQRVSGGGTYGAERQIAYDALRAAGHSDAQATQALREADAYFNGIGVTESTPTRIPGNRRP